MKINNIFKKYKKYIIIACAMFLVLGLVFSLKFVLHDKGVREEYKEEIIVDVKPGMSTVSIARMLEDAGIINHSKYFVLWTKVRGLGNKLQAGKYRFYKDMSVNEVIDDISSGRTVLAKVTIPEGFSSMQIAERLSSLGLGEFLEYIRLIKQKKLEGYLYPETYYFDPATSEEDVLEIMVAMFDREISPILDSFDFSKFKDKKYKFGKYEALILASLIEREAKIDSERSVISAVFHNRLQKRWYLESCATVQFALGRTKSKLSYKDLEVDSIYNTYKHYGLSPGPICSPGKKSMIAALNPVSDDVMFFVRNNNPNGEHIFSKHYKTHLKSKKNVKGKK